MTVSGVTICMVTPDTVHYLAHVADDVFDAPVDRERSAALAAAPHHLAAIAIADGIVVGQIRGYTQLNPDGPTQLMIDNLGVAPPYQRQGIATQLWRTLTGMAAESEARIVYVITEPDNAGARAFYETLGLNRSKAVVFDAPLEPSPTA